MIAQTTKSLRLWCTLIVLTALMVQGCTRSEEWPTLRSISDAASLWFNKTPALQTGYAWPDGIEFTAPIDLPYINNYPAFSRLGARGLVTWRNDQLIVELHEISHARERNLWFDCREIKQVRVGLSPSGPYDSRLVNNPVGHWSSWQTVNLHRPSSQPLVSRGTWSFTVTANASQLPWAQRLTVEALCRVQDGSDFSLTRTSSTWFLAKSAHAQARASDPCAQTLSLRDGLQAQCISSVVARLTTANGRQELRQAPNPETSWLDIAIAEHLPEALRPLVKAGVDVNGTRGDQHDTALIYAAGNGDAEAVRELLLLGAKLDQADAKGYTAYNAAATSGYGDLALELAGRGVERDANTGSAYTALSLAAYYGEIQTVRRLLESGSDPDKQMNGWYNALHHAVKKNNVELARLLLAGGANPNVAVTARRGETPLMMAAENGNIEVINLLRSMGAQLNVIDKMGKNATDYAEFFRKAEASNHLCQLGLEPTALDTSAKNGETAKRVSCKMASVGR
jgi:ankyrin repeat protein